MAWLGTCRACWTSIEAHPEWCSGQYTDTETGYQYLRARYYDPSTGTFLSRDPLEPITATPYAYGNNDPLNTTDPSGLLGFRLGPIKVGGDGCILGTNPDGSCRGGGAVDAAGGAVETVGRCLGDPITCGENIEIAISPLVVGGMTVTAGYGLFLACASVVGCVVAAPLLVPAVAGGAYATWEAMDLLWFGEGHDRFYHPLGGERGESEGC